MDVRTELVSMAIQMSTMANDLRHRRMNIGALFGMHSKLMDINAYLYEDDNGEMDAGAGESVCHAHTMIDNEHSTINAHTNTHSTISNTNTDAYNSFPSLL